MENKKVETKYQQTFSNIIYSIRNNMFDEELDNSINFYLRNEPDNYLFKFIIAKELLDKKSHLAFSYGLLQEVFNNKEADTDLRNQAKFTMANSLFQTKNYQEAYDLYIELLNTSYRNLSLVGIGRILFTLGYTKESIKAYEKLDSEEKKIRYACELGRSQLGDAKYMAANNNFCRYMERYYRKKDEPYMQMMYLCIKNRDYERAYKFFKKLSRNFVKNDHELLNVYYYLQHFVEVEDLGYNVDYTYLTSQIDNYDLNQFLSFHLEKLYNYDRTCVNHVLIGADLTNLYTYAKAVVDYDKPVKIHFIDYYAFDYKENIASIYGRETSRCLVGTLPNTKNIVSLKVIPQLDDPEKFLKERTK